MTGALLTRIRRSVASCAPQILCTIVTGSVANFMQEVLKGQLPLSARGLGGQDGELFGRGGALPNPIFKLPFA
jgi:hypothetical protein